MEQFWKGLLSRYLPHRWESDKSSLELVDIQSIDVEDAEEELEELRRIVVSEKRVDGDLLQKVMERFHREAMVLISDC